MCSVQPLREFIRQRLTAAAEEIFSEVEKTFIQYEEEIDRQRLLDISSQRADIPYQHSCEETELQSGQKPSNKEIISGLDQEKPEAWQSVKEPKGSVAPLIKTEMETTEFQHLKEENGEICISQAGEQLVLNQETGTIMVKDREQGEPNMDQLFSQNSTGTEHPDQMVTNDKASILRQNNEDKTKPKRHGAVKRALCKICGKSFNQCYLYDHIRTHTGEKRFSCQMCGKKFVQKSNLVTHMRIHSVGKQRPCEICGKTFSRDDRLASHMSMHAGEKPFPCQTCGKGYSQKIHLIRHTKTHTGEKPFECQICGKGFIQKDSLITHTRTHTGEKPFSCQTCGKRFSDRSNLIHHIRTHTGERPYSCKICGKSFIQKINIVTHMKVHSGGKRFPCEFCSLCFSRRANLTCHMSTHTGLEAFSFQPSEHEFSEVEKLQTPHERSLE
ncbi:zinc finger protein OZF-like isoform X1 [Cyprinodon tularosa]|uniref:zinc finger protein OZF-like isoform X1 n=1 Tax=Cyprinodon tularosa TaxID=77115 RepID=UPI0018E278B4|nr:zinc finger protein OZF-like isoform X1 [Cyprinodon tularosa]